MPDLFVAQPNTNETPSVIEVSKPTKVGMFATYGERPENVHFDIQEPTEQIILFLRQDFITNVPWIFFSILLIALPIVFTVAENLSNMPLISIPANFSFVLLSFYYLFIATYIFINFITWFFNISLVTNLRVMDVDFADIIYKKVSETRLDLIQDVSYKQVGAIPTFYDFGNVMVQTAAPIDTFEMNRVPRPQHVVEVIQELMRKEKPNVT